VADAGSKDITALLLEWGKGNHDALQELTPLVYDQLRHLAAGALRRERPGHTLQSTALVHEAYLKLIDQQRVRWQDRDHFFAIAAKIIRRILVTHARGRNAVKRGGANVVITLDESITPVHGPDVDLVSLDEALESLARMDPQQGKIVELRFFGGLSIESTAQVLGISDSTVKREWNLARAWLKRELTRIPDRIE
jgi:RNA polymerase sigma factor (TIGR02999 family)